MPADASPFLPVIHAAVGAMVGVTVLGLVVGGGAVLLFTNERKLGAGMLFWGLVSSGSLVWLALTL